MSVESLTEAQKNNIELLYEFMEGTSEPTAIIQAFAQQLHERTGAIIKVVRYINMELVFSVGNDEYVIYRSPLGNHVEWVRKLG